MLAPSADPRLAQTDRGVVSRGGGGLDLRFDGVDVTLSAGQLREMTRTVATARARPNPAGWALRAETAGQRAVFRLTGDAADALGDLLDRAVAVLDLDALVLDARLPRPLA